MAIISKFKKIPLVSLTTKKSPNQLKMTKNKTVAEQKIYHQQKMENYLLNKLKTDNHTDAAKFYETAYERLYIKTSKLSNRTRLWIAVPATAILMALFAKYIAIGFFGGLLSLGVYVTVKRSGFDLFGRVKAFLLHRFSKRLVEKGLVNISKHENCVFKYYPDSPVLLMKELGLNPMDKNEKMSYEMSDAINITKRMSYFDTQLLFAKMVWVENIAEAVHRIVIEKLERKINPITFVSNTVKSLAQAKAMQFLKRFGKDYLGEKIRGYQIVNHTAELEDGKTKATMSFNVVGELGGGMVTCIYYPKRLTNEGIEIASLIIDTGGQMPIKIDCN